MSVLGPVFPVELTTTLRRSRYFVVRVLYLLVLAVTLWVTVESTSWVRWSAGGGTDWRVMAQIANQFFNTFVVVQLLAVLAVAPAVVAGTIAEERSRRTIEYLFVTHLRDTEIVLGKLLARLVPITLLLAAGLPILAIVMTLGGISPKLLLQCFCLTASTLLWVTALSICVSVFYGKARDAVTSTYGMLFALLAVIPFAWGMYESLQIVTPYDLAVETVLTGFNPFYVLAQVLWAGAWSGTDQGWVTLGLMVLYHAVWTVGCVLLAIWRLRPAHLQARARALPAARAKKALRRRPGRHAMLWKEIYVEGRPTRFRRTRRWLTVLAVIAWAVVVAWQWLLHLDSYGMGSRFTYWYFSVWTSVLISTIGLVIVTARAASCVTIEREQDTWLMLISTPLEAREIVRAKFLGTLYSARVILVVLAIAWLPLPLVVGRAALILIVVALTLAVLAAFFCMFGIWCSLRSASSVRAQAAAVGIGMFLGGGYLFCSLPIVLANGPGQESMMVLAACVPFLLSSPWNFLTPEGVVLGASEWDIYVTAWGVGVCGYAFGAWVFYSLACTRFDHLVGRSDSASDLPRPVTPIAESRSP
ncbi:MAG: ABC transporter permease subunit [Pirellulales bacterium]|nr:ABC transporter permease subunit [Pirellulales bacterium]